MSQTAIPNEFAKYMQNQISVGLAPDMNEMIFAYIPDLDPSQPIDLTQGLPSVGTWVYQQDIDQLGKLGDNALVYSTIIKGEEEFTFNAIYLRDKNVPNSCGMVVHKAEETKELGSTLTRSLMMEYVNAAQIVGVIDDAATWQIDYQARLKGMDEDLRLACLDNYGHTAFVDGFDVTQQADPNKYKITPGVVYVGGLRAVLSGEVLQTITTKPNGLYVDVVRQGTALSAWENTLTIKVSEAELIDYVDEAGRNHYVAKLAGINADGSVVDWRVKGGILGELEKKYSPKNKPTASELDLVPASTYMDWLSKGVNIAVVGMMGWSKFGNSHVIFDASCGLTPANADCSNINAAQPWEPGYPTLMGYNSETTFGVRVDSARVSDVVKDCWSAKAVGEPFSLSTHITGVQLPPAGKNEYRYIKLSSGDVYNGDILINEIVTGTAPVLSVTAEINFPSSTMHGQRVELRNTSKVFSRAGENGGTVIGDTMRDFTFNISAGNNTALGLNATGVLNGVMGPVLQPTIGPAQGLVSLSLDLSKQVPVGGENQPVHIEELYFMRIF